ncbi:Ppx/GppA phosphatase family protein [Plantactinospora sp. KLBMP9567]|uniref:Ppx/GppA phosphatase family protein n=1 Tax=Plantactinospora sp. KLBMP9567 TaxID=3085900 RepID=UPI00298266B3|nr:Ppx/GppA phosphatase family protein [Plantactinospora sp. KLBMP9567]MDW5323277.1 Ppx/GppA phosphatase family protein [Plantactinospora sp. KLBMP9567]
MAAIDCGTNSIRLLVADLPDPSAGAEAELAEVVRRMEIVRLGQDLDRTGRLAPEALERTRQALVGYATSIESLGVSRVRMCATSASRDASNAGEFRAMVVDTLGVEPEVVTGDEEARLSFTGAVRGLGDDVRAPYLVVDIGGGSTEFVVGGRPAGGGAAAVDAAVSVDIGCVRMTERHLHGDPPTPEQLAAAEADITAVVDRALSVVPGREAATLIGLAGSVTTVAGIALGLPEYRPDRIHHARIPYADVLKVTSDLLARSSAERLTIPVMHPGRADVIGAGALVLRIVMERAGMSSVIASERDILDGIAYSLLPA